MEWSFVLLERKLQFKQNSVCDERGLNVALIEEQYQKRYRAYVGDNFGVVLSKKKICAIVSKKQDILTVLAPQRNIEIARRTDLVFCKGKSF